MSGTTDQAAPLWRRAPPPPPAAAAAAAAESPAGPSKQLQGLRRQETASTLDGSESAAGSAEGSAKRPPSSHSPGSSSSSARSSAAEGRDARSLGGHSRGRCSKERLAKLKVFLMDNGFSTVHSQRRKLGVTSYPLHVAVRGFDVQMVGLLLEHGADPTKTDSWGETPQDLLLRKSWRGNPDAVDAILALLEDAAPEPLIEGSEDEG